MGYLGRRIGLSQGSGNSTPGGADGAVGGGILDLFAQGYFAREGNITRPAGSSGLSATGGLVSDYTDPGSGNIYRAHIFTSTGTFEVNSLSSSFGFPNAVEYLVVAGGGAGGANPGNTRGGGGGGGGLRSNIPTVPGGMKTPDNSFTVDSQSYTITVGGGGAAMIAGTSNSSTNPGSESSIGPVGGSAIVSASGGAGGGGRLQGASPGTAPANPLMSGGSGGGGGSGPGSGVGGNTVNATDPLSPKVQGFGGGDGNGSGPNYGAGGGGGAGAAGADGTTAVGGNGGSGLQVFIGGPSASVQPVGTPGSNPGGGYFAGGGGGGVYTGSGGGSGGDGGGGDGGETSDSTAGEQSTGGGGGGNSGKAGGSGIVVLRYKVGEIAGTAKATGGSVSFYNGKTIHTFINSGTFATTTDWSSADVEYLVVGGGGGGGSIIGGGGGAGGYRTGTTPIGAHPVSTSIQIGAGGNGDGGGPGTTHANDATNGTPSYFGTPITSAGGAKGANIYVAGADGASGGGGGYGAAGGAGNDPPVSPPQGNAGGTSAGNPNTWYGPSYVTGGGGGAGIAGGRGVGGHGVVVPTTFRDPVVAPGPTGVGLGMTGPDTTSVTITNGGTGYPASGSGVLVNIAPSVGFGTGMTVNYTSVDGVINAVTVVNPGTGYASGIGITVNGGNDNATFTVGSQDYYLAGGGGGVSGPDSLEFPGGAGGGGKGRLTPGARNSFEHAGVVNTGGGGGGGGNATYGGVGLGEGSNGGSGIVLIAYPT